MAKLMKNKFFFVILIFVFLNLTFLFQNYNIGDRVQEESDKENIGSIFTSSNSIAYEWNLTWGGVDWEIAWAMALDSSDNIYLAGDCGYPYDGGWDMCLVKCNNSGGYQWSLTWGGPYDEDHARAIALDSSGNIYIAGVTDMEGEYDMCLVKFNSSGHYQWNRTWDEGDEDYANAMALDSSGNIYLAGESWNMGYADVALVKFNSSGHYQWSSTWDGGDDDIAYGVALDSSNNIYLTGESWSMGYADVALVKFNNSGHYQWNRTLSGNNDEGAYAIALDPLDNIYLAGYTYDTTLGDSDMCVVKFDSSGQYQWNCTYASIYDEYAYAIVLDSTSNSYLAGYRYNIGESEYDMYLVKIDNSGKCQWDYTWDGGYEDYAYGVALDSSENIYLAGSTWNNTNEFDLCLVKINSPPKILINSPSQNEFYGIIAPSFDISILESELHTTWYTLDGGTTNITFSGAVGMISQIEWDKKEDDVVYIEFFANDWMSLEGTSKVSVFKDTNAPTSIILFTLHKAPNIVNKSTTFNLTADDGDGSGVASIMYTINDGDWINYSTPFDLSDFKSGNYNISYYSIDKVGNIENVNSVLVKIPGPGAIPGYNISLLISLICVISVISFRFRNKILKF